MRAPSRTSSRREPVRHASAAERRRPGARPERYDSERLPVLLRLPDVYERWVAVADSAGCPSVAEELPEAAGAAAPALVPARDNDAASPSTAGVRSATSRPPRSGRRRVAADDTAAWLPGVKRFFFATLMAAALLVVIVTIQQWNQPATSRTPTLPEPAVAGRVDASPLQLPSTTHVNWSASDALNNNNDPGDDHDDDTAQHGVQAGGVVSTSDAGTDTAWPPRLDSASNGLGWADADESPVGPESSAASAAYTMPVVPGAIGCADGVDVSAVQYEYPSTGRAPVAPEIPVPSASPLPTWPLPAGGPALHSADRNHSQWTFPPR